MNLQPDDLPETLYVIAAIPENAGDDYIPQMDEGLTLVSLTDAEDGAFAPVWTTEEGLASWVRDFDVKVISVNIARDVLLPLMRESGCDYLAVNLRPGQEQFPPNQVLIL